MLGAEARLVEAVGAALLGLGEAEDMARSSLVSRGREKVAARFVLLDYKSWLLEH